MIKLVVSDMDGTLLSHSSGLTEGNLKAIHKLYENGIDFAIASGRDYDGVYSVARQYNLECEAILGNGAQYVDKTGKLLMSSYMNKSVVKDVVKAFESRGFSYALFTTKGFYTGGDAAVAREKFVARGVRRFGVKREDYDLDGRFGGVFVNHLIKINDYDAFLATDVEIIKIESFALTVEEVADVQKDLQTIPTISYLSSFDDNIEVTDQYAQKGLILEKVIELKGLKKEEVAVMGDGMNDITMFECFPYSFAPENAEELIKQKAHKVVRDCEEDGAAEAIDYIINVLNMG